MTLTAKVATKFPVYFRFRTASVQHFFSVPHKSYVRMINQGSQRKIGQITAIIAKKKVHSGPKCLPRVACLSSKIPMFQRAGMREGGKPLPLAFRYLILMI